MSSWRVWISFSKLLWGNVFLKNHAKSKVFQNNRRQPAFFVKIWCQVGELVYDSFDGWDGISKVSFKFLYTLWVYRKCIYLYIIMFKVCHQLFYGFENLMSSWRVWISFSKLLRGNVFLKNHAKSKVFQNNRRQPAFFVKIWCQVGELGYDSHGRPQAFLNLFELARWPPP